MNSLPPEHSGIGSATNSTFRQVGSAVGVAVIGSVLASQYRERLTGALAPYHLPPRALIAAAAIFIASLLVLAALPSSGRTPRGGTPS